MLDWIFLGSAFIAAAALVMTVINIAVLGKLRAGGAAGPLVSVCIPARNEAENIGACVERVLGCGYANVEVLVYDDQSTDGTPEILAGLMARDPRVKRVPTAALPEGWNGKQHACWRMSEAAAGEWMLFTDADVRLVPGAIGASVAAAARLNAGLISAFPRQVVGSVGEALLVPMIFFVLLSYLPFPRMRRSNDPATSAGCGQFLFVSRAAYGASGGHAAFRDSMHDGIKMPRAVRRAGMHTDLIDGTHLAECRMYRGFGAAWRGFTKNAYEGLGSMGLLVFATVLHVVGHLLPWGAAVWWAVGRVELAPAAMVGVGVAIGAGVVQRLILCVRFGHPLWIAAAHPVGVALMVGVQWWSWYLSVRGRRAWRGRTAAAGVSH